MTKKLYIAFLIDLIFLLVISSPVLFALIWQFTNPNNHTNSEDFLFNEETDFYISILFYLNILAVFFWLILKDILNLSFGKRIMKLKILDRNTLNDASPIKKIIRNIPFLVFPLFETLKILSPKAKFGDLLANTELRSCNKVEK